jgi:hypothetical protein
VGLHVELAGHVPPQPTAASREVNPSGDSVEAKK